MNPLAPLLDDEHLRAASAGAGPDRHQQRRPRPAGNHEELLGMVLALVESAVPRDLADAPADSLGSRYWWMLPELAGQDRPGAARRWVLLFQDRLDLVGVRVPVIWRD